jgi:hypothetical protein
VTDHLLRGWGGPYATTVRNGLVADNGKRKCWATIRSGLSKGLRRPIVGVQVDGLPGRRRSRTVHWPMLRSVP